VGTKERRRREREDTREKILHAARELFVERGFEDVTMRGIARAIDYTPTAIYHHFESKEDLVTQLCHTDFVHLARHFVRAAAIADPVERIRAIGEAYLDFAVEYPNHYRFMFITMLPADSRDFVASHKHDNPEEDAYAFLRRACGEAIEQKLLRPELTDADELCQILWGALHGLISIHLIKRNEPWVPLRDLKSTAHRVMDCLFTGILAKQER
jgi:AcrR family transcriptional regulator